MEMSRVKPLSGPVEPSARIQVDFVGATPFRENQMEMPMGPPAWRRGTDGTRVGAVYAELDTASFFRWSMKTCRLTSSVRIGAPVSWNQHTNSRGSTTCRGRCARTCNREQDN